MVLALVLAGVRVGGAITETKLTASDGEAQDFFGQSVSLSADTALIGAPIDDDHGPNSGSAYIFVQNGTTWSQAAKLTASDGGANEFFGQSVSLSADTALIGAPSGNYPGPAGSAYIFVQNGTTWSQAAKLTASDEGNYSLFGFSVSLDGDTALIGARFGNEGTGSAYVFLRNGTNWSQQAKLTASDGAINDEFGWSVSLNGDTALVGAPFANERTGSAYVFVRDGTNWSQQAKLTACDLCLNDYFGISVSLSGDTALMGAPPHGDTGAAFVFVRSGSAWSQQAELRASDGQTGDGLGVALSVDQDTAVVAAPSANNIKGAAYVFVRNATKWSQQAKLTASDGMIYDDFGRSVSLGGDTVVIGAPFGDGRVRDSGAAYVYLYVPTVPSPPQNLIANRGDGQVALAWQAPSSDGGSPITNYRIYRGNASGGESFLAQIGNTFRYTDANVVKGVTYYYQVTAVNAIGESPRSNEAGPTVPSTPQNLGATSGDAQVALAWQAPSSDGDSPVTNYRIYRGTAAGTESLLAEIGNVSSYTDAGLMNGVTYYYEVSAVNAVGEGPRSNEISATPATIPAAPWTLGGTPGDRLFALTWQVPSSDGGSPITNYRIYRGTSSGGELYLTTIGDVHTYADLGVTNGEMYYYQVSALNAIGEGPMSNEVSGTPATTPTGPLVFPPLAGDAQVTLSWQAPFYEGGLPVTNYDIYRGTSSGSESLLNTIGNVLEYVDTGLTNGVTYYYQVSATNAAGEGPRSSEIHAIPTAPRDTTKPTVAITSPASGATLTSATVTVSGTASDNVAVQKVELSTDGTTWVQATGTASWSGTLTLREGPNTIYVRATDTSGNTVTKTITVTLQTVVSGAGLTPLFLGAGIAIAVVVGAVAFAVFLRKSRRKG